ncbi:ABC transporter ATP-binding protein [Fictibacillus sp. BK138]|uniref:ABC transporter ATP-binding protein n=1 Tax=Fictibacillus sp. BK138 TaxID=2512121 RepID=UPI00102A2BD4|nr:ABC transporter ATP-binding protein [Fictibacillus sp. BK138]RZT23836.1 ATP-binding cassette subfamily B protein/subfamily B ATP-binding cassette protein MsbA [Fictibacillus sp. BK138]
MDNIKWLLHYIKKIKWFFLFSVLLLCLESMAIIATFGLQKFIIDDVFINGQYDRLVPILLMFAGAFIAYALLFTLAPHTFHRIQAKVIAALTQDFMNYMQRIPVKTFHNERVTKYVHYLSNDVSQVAGMIGGYIPRLIQLFVTIAVLSVIIFISSPILLASILVFSALYIVMGRHFSPLIRTAGKEAQDRKTDLLIHIEEGISSTREVIAYNRTDWETSIYNRHFKRYFNAVMKQAKINNKQLLASEPLKWGASLIVIGYGGYSVIQGNLSIGMFIIVYQFTGQLMDALHRLFAFSMDLSNIYANVDRLRSVIESPTEKDGSIPFIEKIESIQFDKVSFSYNEESDKNVLHDLTFTIPAGKKVAFVGTSGGGKSTIAQLLMRFFKPTEGNVFINSHSIHDLIYADWTKQTGFVTQEPYLFPDTVRNNLLLGRDISHAKMIEACEISQIHAYIESLSEGYDTEIGERGITLSGGQRQRLALARAIIANPEVLILDEATSALDLETERQVQCNFDLVREGKTTIVIAHRLSTVQNADIIYVMDNGSIVEQGTHDKLMQENTVYKSLVYAEKTLEVGA